MRNVLVLVPLCIGLSSGFIVSTSTIEPSETTTRNLLLNPKAITLIDENVYRVNFTSSTSKTLPKCLNTKIIQESKESKIEKELLAQTAEKDNHIIERSFIFVNQRWKKLPKQSYLIDSKQQNNNKFSQKPTVLDLNQETPRKPPKNFISKASNADTKYFNNVQRHVVNKIVPDKSHFPPVQNIQKSGNLKAKVNNNVNANNKHQAAHKHSGGHREYLELLKAPLLRLGPRIDIKKLSDDNDVMSNRNYNNGNINKQSNQKQKINTNIKNDCKLNEETNNREQQENLPLFKNKLHELADELNDEIAWDKLFQHTLEEQVPDRKTSHNYNYNDPNNIKYCQECAWKANLQKLEGGMLTECKCKCGRYIHLRGRPDLKDLVDRKREILQKAEGIVNIEVATEEIKQKNGREVRILNNLIS